jgi:hypothetical protein
MYIKRDKLIYFINLDNLGEGRMWYIFWFLVGFGLATTGGVTILSYLNYIPIGVTFTNFLIFISNKPECYLFPIGIIIIILTAYLYPTNK